MEFMEIRTFYWYDRLISNTRYQLKRLFGKRNNAQFKCGNAGDIYARQLLEHYYGLNVSNIREPGNRILSVGSIGHRAGNGDLLCGVGLKDPQQLPLVGTDITIYGLRGPLSFDAFKAGGFDMSKIKFLYDPGLLIKYLIPQTPIEPSVVSFIPHYRERFNYRGRLPKEIKLVDIDNDPQVVARSILKSKLVYASSLHGIIFSHSLGVPCIYVKPQTEEPEFKFIDYYESVNLPYKKPLSSIASFDFQRDSDTPADIRVIESDFYFPTVEELTSRGIITESQKERLG